MQQVQHRLDTERGEAFHARILPGPVADAVALDAFPVGRIAQGAQTERGDAVEIVDAILMPAHHELVEDGIADPVDGAFDSAPEVEVVQWVFLDRERRVPALSCAVIALRAIAGHRFLRRRPSERV